MRYVVAAVLLVLACSSIPAEEGFPQIPVDEPVYPVAAGSDVCTSPAACHTWAVESCVGPAWDFENWFWTGTECYVVCRSPCPPGAPWYCWATTSYLWQKAVC